jgi:hypothetical protein
MHFCRTGSSELKNKIYWRYTWEFGHSVRLGMKDLNQLLQSFGTVTKLITVHQKSTVPIVICYSINAGCCYSPLVYWGNRYSPWITPFWLLLWVRCWKNVPAATVARRQLFCLCLSFAGLSESALVACYKGHCYALQWPIRKK